MIYKSFDTIEMPIDGITTTASVTVPKQLITLSKAYSINEVRVRRDKDNRQLSSIDDVYNYWKEFADILGTLDAKLIKQIGLGIFRPIALVQVKGTFDSSNYDRLYMLVPTQFGVAVAEYKGD